jgi:hypothetical protein
MCCGGASQSIQKTEIPKWLEDFYKKNIAETSQVYGAAKNLYKQNLNQPTYGGQRIQGFTPDQLKAMKMARGSAGTGLDSLQKGQALAEESSRGITQGQIDKYMNPYTQEVLNPALREAAQANQQLGLQQQARSVAQGAFGGSRGAIQAAERERGYTQNVGDLTAKAYSTAFSGAMGQANADRARQLQAGQLLGQQGAQEQAMGVQDINTLLGTGAMQQTQGQRGLDLAYGNFMEQREQPYQNLARLQAALKGSYYQPGPTGSTTTSTAPQANPFSQIAGLGLSGLSLYGGFGGFSPGGFGSMNPWGVR